MAPISPRLFVLHRTFYREFLEFEQMADCELHNTTGSVDPCWLRSDTEDLFWVGGNSTTSHYAGTGPSGDHTTGSGEHAFTRSSSPWTANTDTELRTPLIDLDTTIRNWPSGTTCLSPTLINLNFCQKARYAIVLVNTITTSSRVRIRRVGKNEQLVYLPTKGMRYRSFSKLIAMDRDSSRTVQILPLMMSKLTKRLLASTKYSCSEHYTQQCGIKLVDRAIHRWVNMVRRGLRKETAPW